MKDGLNEIAGHCRVAADQHAGVTEQIAGMSIEARGKFLGLVRWDLLLTQRR